MNLNLNLNSLNNRQDIKEGGRDVKISDSVKRALVKAGLTEGSVFNGKIQDITGKSVKILLSGGETLPATLENGAGFNIGEQITFVVKSNDGAKIVLQPTESSASSALSQSLANSIEQLGLVLDERNTAMVKEMMAFGMPLDASSLNSMEKLVDAYPNSSVENIVLLNAHDIPVTEENLGQLEAYQGYEHKITENIDNLANELTKLAESNPKAAEKLLDEVLSFKEPADVPKADIGEANNQYRELSDINIKESAAQGETISKPNGELISDSDGTVVRNTNANIEGEKSENFESSSRQEVSERLEANGQAEAKSEISGHDAAENSELQSKEMQSKNSDTLAFEKPEIEQTKLGAADRIEDKITQLKESLLLKAESFEGKTGEEIKNAVSEKLKEIYEAAEKIMTSLKNGGMEKTDAFKSAEGIKNNLQFMNDLNHVAAYVQLPYQTMSGKTDGELFVYRRNKNKSLDDGPLTAFLHLDMEYLGATDIKVTMDKSGKVSTRFSLSDTISQDIVEEHLPELKKRLERLGYTAELFSEIKEEEESDTPFKKILEIDKPRNEVKRYGFDIRL